MGSELAKGTLLAGKYRILRRIGQGGMGEVYAAEHSGLAQCVALKLLSRHLADDEVASARFLQEARAAARVQDPRVVRVMDVGTYQSSRPFLVMELLEGRDLGEVLRADGEFAPEAGVDLLLEMLEGVAAIHARGIVHRDLKPSNVFLTRRDGVKILDFGIAKLEDADGSVTASQSLVGSPAYASPEQLRGARNVDARSDIWSLGVLTFQILSGELPFEGATAAEVSASVLEHAPRSLVELAPQVSTELEALVMRCLERSKEKRFGSVVELATALAPLASARGRVSVTRIEERSAASFPHDDAPDDGVPDESWRTETLERAGPSSAGLRTAATWSFGRDLRARRLPVVGSVIVLSGAAVALAFALRRNHPPAADASGSAARPPPAAAPTPEARPIAPETPSTAPASSAPPPVRGVGPKRNPSAAPPTPAASSVPEILRERF